MVSEERCARVVKRKERAGRRVKREGWVTPPGGKEQRSERANSSKQHSINQGQDERRREEPSLQEPVAPAELLKVHALERLHCRFCMLPRLLLHELKVEFPGAEHFVKTGGHLVAGLQLLEVQVSHLLLSSLRVQELRKVWEELLLDPGHDIRACSALHIGPALGAHSSSSLRTLQVTRGSRQQAHPPRTEPSFRLSRSSSR